MNFQTHTQHNSLFCTYCITWLENVLGKKQNWLARSARFTKPSMWITVLKPGRGCTERSAPGQPAEWKAIGMPLSRSPRTDTQLRPNHHNFHKWSDDRGKKWKKAWLSNQWAQKISLLADDPSTTSWRKSQEDLPPLRLHNRGHTGENIASDRTFSLIPFFIIITLYLLTADSYLVYILQFISLSMQ